MAPVVHAAVPEDAESVRALMHRVVASSVEASLRQSIMENVEANVSVWLGRPLECVHLVARIDDSIVGVVLVKDFWNLCSLFVEPSAQGRSVGRLLVEAAAAECRGKSPKNALFLNAYPSAVGFYERLGFTPKQSAQSLPSGIQPMALEL